MNSDFSNKFLGKGIAFPFKTDNLGRIRMNSLEDHVLQSIKLILGTAKSERVMRPDFGAGLQKHVFDPISPSTKAFVEHEVETGLIKFEPRIEVLKVEANFSMKDDAVLLINISYRVRRTDTMFNMVYPFYLERGEL